MVCKPLALVFVALFLGREAFPQQLPCADYSLHPAPVARIELGEGASSIAAAAGYAYVADGGEGVRILDIHDPRNPVIIGTVLADDPDLVRAETVQTEGGRLYVRVVRWGQGSRLDVYDLADPASPTLLAANLAVGSFCAFDRSLAAVTAATEIEVLDLEDPLHPVSKVTLTFPGRVRAVDARSDRIYAAVGPRPGYPTNALFVVKKGNGYWTYKRIDLPGTPLGVSVNGSTAYLTWHDGLMIVDDTEAADPAVHDGPFLARYASFVARGTVGFGLGPGLWIYDLADPVHPRFVANARVPLLYGLSTSSERYAVAVDDGYAFVVRQGGGLSVFAITGAATDVNWVNLPFPRNAAFVHRGTFGYAGVDSTLQVFDISVPSEPRPVASVALPGRITALTADGTTMFAGAWRSDGTRLVRVDVQDPREPAVVWGEPLFPGWYEFRQILVDGGRIFVTGRSDGRSRLGVIDASAKEPTIEAEVELEFLGFEGTTWEGPRIARSGEFLYVTAYRGFRVFETSTPGAPVQDAVWEQAKHLSGDIAVRDKTVFLTLNTRREWYDSAVPPGDRRPGLRVFDVSDASYPREIGCHDTVDGANGMVMAGDVAYVQVTSAGITILDLADPRAPREIGYWLAPFVGRFAVVQGDLLTFAPHDPWLSVSGPACDVAVPVFLLSFAAAWNGNAVVLDWRVAGDDPGTRFRLDAVTGEERREVSYQRTGAGTFRARDTWESAGEVRYELYLQSREGSWSLLAQRTVRSPGAPGPVLAAFPNPFSAGTAVHYRVDAPGPVDLVVFDTSGRRVRTLLDEREDSGDHQASWDGRDDAGLPVAAGVYHLRLRTRDRVATRKLVVRP